MRRIGHAVAALALAAAWASASPPETLLPNGDFETAGADGRPAHWPMPAGASWAGEDGNRFLRLQPPEPGATVVVYREVPLVPTIKALALRFRVRVRGLKRGKANWHDGRIVLDFRNAAGEKLKGGPGHPNFRGSSGGWIRRRIEFLVPEGAVKLIVMPALFAVRSGTMDVDDLALTAVDPAPILRRERAEAARRAAEVARRAAKVKPRVPPVPPAKMPPMLRVVGADIRTFAGKRVWLQGVAIPSMEWTAAGEHVLESVRVAFRDWGANCIRLPIREHFWAGTGPYQKDGGAGYRQLVADVVNLAAARRAYTVLDLHCFRAPGKEHAEFWRKAAGRFKNNAAVLFELFNEPHDISWDVWQRGGEVVDREARSRPLAERPGKRKRFRSVGMQGLVDAVRGSGAKNLVIVGGLDWGYDLSGVLTGHALDDRGGNGIVYSSHVYPWKDRWRERFLNVAAIYPVFIGECGAPGKRLHFIPPERHEDAATWVPDFLAVVQKHKLHWTAWSFHPSASPCMLKDWTYEPTPHWGALAKQALAGRKFELKKLR